MRKMNKKAWLRIVEAFIAALIILSTVLIIISNQSPKSEIGEDIYEKQTKILDILRKNNIIRPEILGAVIEVGDPPIHTPVEIRPGDQDYEIDNFISDMIPVNWDFLVMICAINEICNSENTPNDKEVHATEVLVTSDLSIYSPRKLRFFVWMK